MTEPMSCDRCGAVVRAAARFCPRCGSAVRGGGGGAALLGTLGLVVLLTLILNALLYVLM